MTIQKPTRLRFIHECSVSIWTRNNGGRQTSLDNSTAEHLLTFCCCCTGAWLVCILLTHLTLRQGGVMWLFNCCCLSVVLSFCERDNSRTRLRMSTKHDGRRRDPLEMVKFCCWSGSECGSRISFSLSVTSGDRTYYTICCHSPEDDTAAALVEFALSEHMLFCVYFPYVGNEVCIFDLTYYKLAPPFVSHLFPSGTDSGRPNRAFDQSISWWRRCWIKNSGLSMTSWRHRDHVTSHLQRHLSYVVRDGRSSKRLYCSLLP